MKKITIKLHIFILCLLGLLLSGGIAAASERTVSKEEIIQLTNQERRNAGLSELAENALLDAAAEKKARDMVGNNYFAHTSPAGVDPWHWFEDVDYQYKYAGENLAMDFTSAVSVNRAWMKSPSHRDNILSDKFTEIGVAVIDGIIDEKETLVAVQLFGTPFSQNKSSAVPVEAAPSLGVKVEEASMYPWKGNQEDELLVYAKVDGDPTKVEAIIGEKTYELTKHRQNTYMNLFLLSEIQPENAQVVIRATIDDEKSVFYTLSEDNIVTAVNEDNANRDASVMAAASGNQASRLIRQFIAQNGLLSVCMIFFIVILANIWVLEKEEENIILHAQAS